MSRFKRLIISELKLKNYIFDFGLNVETEFFRQSLEQVLIGELRLNFVTDFIDGGISFLFRLKWDSFEVFLKIFEGFDEERLEVLIISNVYFVIERVKW